MEKGNTIFAGIIIAFIGVILAIALLQSSADTISTMTDTYSVTNQSFTGVLSGNTSLADSDDYKVNSVSKVVNTTTTLTVSTDYNVSGNGIIIYTQNDTYYADYVYQTDSYNESGAVRAVSGLIILFAALAIAVFALSQIDFKALGF